MLTYTRTSVHVQMKIAMLFIMLLAFSIPVVSAQGQHDGIDQHIQRIDMQIAQASAEKNNEAVAGLQRDRDNWVRFKHAIETEDLGTIMALQDAISRPYVYVPSNGAAVVDAPEPQGPAGPEFVNQVYHMPSDGVYTPLEKQETNTSSSGGGYGGFGGRTSSVKVPGEKSNVRFPSGKPRFVIKTFQGMDPMDVAKLVRFEVRGKNKDRYADLSKSSHAWYHSSSSEVTANRVRIAFTNIGNQIYEIQFEEDLLPGEYGFMASGKVFAFGID